MVRVSEGQSRARLANRVGWPRILSGVDPAPGAEASITIPGGSVIRVLDFRVVFVASAVAANRRPVFTVDDGSRTVAQVPIQQNITANQSWTLHWSPEYDHGISDSISFVACIAAPALILPPGYRIRTVTTLLDAGDNYAAPILYGLEYPKGWFFGEGS